MGFLWQGALRKMRTKATDPVSYYLTDGWHEAGERSADEALNPLLGRLISLRFTGKIHCTACGRATKRTFGEGFCFPCSQARADADICMVRPELCHHGQPDHPCRDESFAQEQCFQNHVLYCALTSGVKIGITRQKNIPGRWIDQGAIEAVALAVLPDRRTVGLLEKRLSEEGFRDRTHWTKLLSGRFQDSHLQETVAQVTARLADWEAHGLLPEFERVVQKFTYPVLEWPTKVKSLNLDKDPEAGGVLLGIKGQYLILSSGVLNLRKFSGYQAEVSAS